MQISMRILLSLLMMAVGTSALAGEEVNVYSARKEKLIKPILDQFTEATGIAVNLMTGKADALLKRLYVEGANTPADVLITTDAGRLHRAKMMGVLQPVHTKPLHQRVPEIYRDVDSQWFGLSLRARPIMYSPRFVKAAELSTYEDLADPKWKGRVCLRSSSNIYNQSLVASMLEANGEEKTEIWAKHLVANMARPPKGGDRDQIKAVAAGQCEVTLANTYYLGKMLKGRDKEQRRAAKHVKVFWPNKNDRGAHVNVSGAGITKHAGNRANAIKLMEYLVSDKAQQWYAEANHEYPVVDGVASSKLLKSWGEFKKDSVNLTRLGVNNPTAVKVMDRAGWK